MRHSMGKGKAYGRDGRAPLLKWSAAMAPFYESVLRQSGSHVYNSSSNDYCLAIAALARDFLGHANHSADGDQPQVSA